MKVSPLLWSVFATVVALASAEANEPPVAVDDSFHARGPQSLLSPVQNDSDPDGDALTITSLTQPAHGKVSLDANTNLVWYEPGPDFAGQDSFAYQISDPSGATATATV